MTTQERTRLLAEKQFLTTRIDSIPVAAGLTRASLQSRLRTVEGGLQATLNRVHRDPARARLTFGGRPVVRSHGVFADFGTKAAGRFVDAIAAVAASITAPLAAMGPIPGRDQNQLLIVGTAIGSFGFELEEHQVDAAVFASDTLDRITARQPDTASKVRVIWKSPLIAADPLVWRKDLPAATKIKIKDFFLNYGRTGPNAAQEKAQLEKLQFSGFKDSSDAQLNPVRQLELFKDKNKIEADTNLNVDEKKAKLDDIDRKLTELAKA